MRTYADVYEADRRLSLKRQDAVKQIYHDAQTLTLILRDDPSATTTTRRRRARRAAAQCRAIIAAFGVRAKRRLEFRA